MKQNKKIHHIRLRIDETLQKKMTEVMTTNQFKNKSQLIRDSIDKFCRAK